MNEGVAASGALASFAPKARQSGQTSACGRVVHVAPRNARLAGIPERPQTMPKTPPPPDSLDLDSLSLGQEFLLFLRFHPWWWLTPILTLVVLLVALYLYADQPAAPFLYALF